LEADERGWEKAKYHLCGHRSGTVRMAGKEDQQEQRRELYRPNGQHASNERTIVGIAPR